MIIYAFLTCIVALCSGIIFNINPYLPMLLCILICIIANIIYFFMKDVSKNNIIKNNKTNKNKKIKLSKIVLVILINYAIFYGIITAGQQNSKLLIQYELSDLYNTARVSLYLGIVIAFSRIARLLSTIAFGKIYPKLKNKSLIFLPTMLLIAFIIIIIGYFCSIPCLKFTLMAIGFCIILSARDPYRLYTQDIILKITKPEEHQVAISYIQFSRKIGSTICCLIISAVLSKWNLIYVIFGISTLAFFEVLIVLKLYSLLNKNLLLKF